MASFHPHHPPEDCVNCEHRHLRMRLLEELAREVSRAYNACRLDRVVVSQQRGRRVA